MTIEPIVTLSGILRWTCDTCGAVTDHPSEAVQREAEIQHNSPRLSHARGGINRSPCEANRIDSAGVANL